MGYEKIKKVLVCCITRHSFFAPANQLFNGVFVVVLTLPFIISSSCIKAKVKPNDLSAGNSLNEVAPPPPHRLDSLAIYYGWPSSLNSGLNNWDREKVAEDLSRYSLVVLGAGLEEESHEDHGNTKDIITQAKQMNPSMKFLGYVTIRHTGSPASKIQKWKNMGADGVFLDEMGFDYLVEIDHLTEVGARHKQNAWLEAIHGEGLFAMMNAWDPADLFEDNGSLPPLGATSQDYYLLESFLQSSDEYLLPFNQFLQKMQKAQGGRERYGVKFAAINTRADGDGFNPTHWLTMQLTAHFFHISALGWGYPNFSATSAVMPPFSIHNNLQSLVVSNRSITEDSRQLSLSFGNRVCTITYGTDQNRGNDINYVCTPSLE